ncbi:hypothetical protein GCM10022266_19380 [Agrococcus terreus]
MVEVMGDDMDDQPHTDPHEQAPLAPHDSQGVGLHDDPRAPIEHVVDVPVSRARAYDAYVLGLGEWWPQGSTASGTGLDRIDLEPHVGGRIVEHARDGREIVWGEVLEAEAGSRFSHTLSRSHDGSPSRVTLTFADLPHGGTRVLLQHGGWDDSNEHGRGAHADWPMLLERYRSYATHV